jgi:hypothetical protein
MKPCTTIMSTLLAITLLPLGVRAAIVINEFQYDDTGAADDREFVELFNTGTDPVDISGWVLGGYDPTTTNPSATIPASTSIAAGGYYVLGNTGVLNVNQVLTANFLENDNEVITLRDATGALIDAVAYETNKGVGFITTGTTAPSDKAAVALQVGPGVFGNHQGIDIAGTPLNATVSLGRYVDGRDTNNNGRDFALRPGTPGTTNNPGGMLTSFLPPDPSALALGANPPGMVGSFVSPRVIDPTVIDTNNPNAIPASGSPVGNKAYVMWDPSGGGNGATSTGVFPSTAACFLIRAYLDTADLPVQSNNAVPPVQFQGSEITLYGLGGGDALTNLTDLTGAVGLSAATLPQTETANAFTGLAWVYERVGVTASGTGLSEKLHLVDANDGGDADLDGNTPRDWIILKTYDLSATASGWHDLSISLDAAGNGVATYDGQVTTFSVSPTAHHASAFNVGYRENLQIGADGTPDALLRPATFITAPLTFGTLVYAPAPAGSRKFILPVTCPGNTGIFLRYSTDLQQWSDIGTMTLSGFSATFTDTDAGRFNANRGFYKAEFR